MTEIVGITEIAERLGVKRKTVDTWRQRAHVLVDAAPFPDPTQRVGGRPAWRWSVVRDWAKSTGRLS